jgi:cyclopropane-fatty-acyl-phospholipid synthase
MAVMNPTRGAASVVTAGASFLDFVFTDFRPRDFAVRFWDGTTWGPDDGQPARFTVVLKHHGALRLMFRPDRVSLGEAYIFDDYDIEGDIHEFFQLVKYLADCRQRWGWLKKARFYFRLKRLPRHTPPRKGRGAAKLAGTRHSKERDRQAIQYHYDVSNHFYALWLDRRMVYTCAYFASPDEELDPAQERKLDLICRKLRLSRGDRLLDIGCGWGGLMIHAATNYGARVEGVTLSREQADLVRERIEQARLQDRCRVVLGNYLDLTDWGSYDKVTSIEVQEAVGTKMLPAYFGQVHRLLRPGGLFLNQAITLSPALKEARGQSFSNRYVFPDGELQHLPHTIAVAEKAGFEVRDLECLRDHYPITLKHWVRRLEANASEARRLTDEMTYRVWRFYMSGAADGFTRGYGNDYQMLLLKPDGCASRLPLTSQNRNHSNLSPEQG